MVEHLNIWDTFMRLYISNTYKKQTNDKLNLSDLKSFPETLFIEIWWSV